MRKVGIFGGTFDPIHLGHLTMAAELKRALALDEMRLVPCHLTPHREQPGVSSADRAEMTHLAAADWNAEHPADALVVDCRELARDERSYTIDTLLELRRELGDEVSLTLCMGMDSLVGLTRWQRWDELLDCAHIAVAARPGYGLPDPAEQPQLAQWLLEKGGSVESISATAYGTVAVFGLSLLPVSATEIRKQIGAGQLQQAQVTKSVRKYIKDRKLYCDQN